jgi:thiol-disulfide isomerase/thioredoxin
VAATLLSLLLLAVPLRLGDQAPLLEVTGLDGQPLGLDLAGQVTIVDFFATWCPRCRESVAAHDELVASFGDRLRIIVVDVREPAAVVRRFFSHHPLPREVLLTRDPTGAAMRAFGQTGFPSFCLIDRSGKLRFVHSGWGSRSLNSLKEWVSYLLDGANVGAAPGSTVSRRKRSPTRAPVPREQPLPAAAAHDERARRMGVEVLR